MYRSRSGRSRTRRKRTSRSAKRMLMMMPWRRTSEFIPDFRETLTFGVRTDRYHQPSSRLRQYITRLPYAISTVEKAKQPNDEEKRTIVSQTSIILVTIRSSFPATHELLSPVRRIEKDGFSSTCRSMREMRSVFEHGTHIFRISGSFLSDSMSGIPPPPCIRSAW